MKILNKLRKPQIKAKLTRNGAFASVKIINANTDHSLIIVYMIIKHIARLLKIDTRYILNRLIDIDKRINQARKKEYKQARYGKKK